MAKITFHDTVNADSHHHFTLTMTASFHDFLRIRLEQMLPGANAHRKMLPLSSEMVNTEARIKPEAAPISAKQSAVLIPLVSINNTLSVILTVRSEKLTTHKGQISFPGGRMNNDETIIETALREAMEEIHLQTEYVTVIGRLSTLYVPPSNSIIHPIIALIQEKHPQFLAQPSEVDEIFTVPLEELSYESIKIGVRDGTSGMRFKAPYWDVHPRVGLWGATAMILCEVRDLYEEWNKIHS